MTLNINSVTWHCQTDWKRNG